MRLTVILPVLGLLALAACETMEGFGRDVSAGGEAIEEGANEVQDEL